MNNREMTTIEITTDGKVYASFKINGVKLENVTRFTFNADMDNGVKCDYTKLLLPFEADEEGNLLDCDIEIF